MESESRYPSVILVRAASSDPYKLTIAGRAGFAVSRLKSILRKQQQNMESVLCCFVGCRTACCPTHFETITIEQTKLSQLRSLILGILAGSVQKLQ